MFRKVYQNRYTKPSQKQNRYTEPSEEKIDLAKNLAYLKKDLIKEEKPRLLLIHLLQIYKKFYRHVQRRAELLDSGISKISRVIRDFVSVEVAMESCEVA